MQEVSPLLATVGLVLEVVVGERVEGSIERWLEERETRTTIRSFPQQKFLVARLPDQNLLLA
jgi:hypothetical protein